MSRLPKYRRKPETIIRALTAEVKDCRRILANASNDLHHARREREALRSQLTRAEQEIAEWKRRFDDLLHRTPPIDAVSHTVLPAPPDDRRGRG